MLQATNLGNWIYATGGHEAADDMGIDTRRCPLLTPMLAGCGFAGMITTFRLRSNGEGLELQAIAAAVIGGTALTGGIGSVVSVIGTLLIRRHRQRVMARIDANWFRFAIGALTVGGDPEHQLRARAQKMKI